jgi:hypothetical protein
MGQIGACHTTITHNRSYIFSTCGHRC